MNDLNTPQQPGTPSGDVAIRNFRLADDGVIEAPAIDHLDLSREHPRPRLWSY